MTPSPAPTDVHATPPLRCGVDPRLPVFSLAAAAFVVALGLTGLAGWAWDVAVLKSLLPGLASMKANTAAGFVLAGAALLLLATAQSGPRARLAARLLAAAVAMLGLLTLGEYAFGWELGIDQLLFHEAPGAVATGHPGRMAVATALDFLLLGGALLLLATRRGVPAAQTLALLAWAVAALALVGYVFDSQLLIRVSLLTSIAVHTAVGFLVLSTGVLVARADIGLAARLLRHPINLGFGLALAGLLILGAGTYSNTRRLIDSNRLVAHTHLVNTHLAELMSLIVDVETGMRGYIITGDERLLAPYHVALSQVAPTQADLRQLMSDISAQQRRLDRLEPLIEKKIAAVTARVTARRTQGFEAAAALIKGGEAVRLMEEIRSLIDELKQEEEVLLARCTAQASLTTTNTFFVLALGAVCSGGLLIVVFIALRRENRLRQRAELSVRQANEQLEQRVRDRTEELQLERGKLSAAFENMELGVIVSNAQGDDIVMNAAAERMHGFASKADMHAKLNDYANDWELQDATGRVLPFAEWPLPRAVRGDYCRDGEFHLHNLKDGHAWDCSFTAAPVRDEQGQLSLIVLTLVDITVRKRAAQEIRTLNASLEQRVAERTAQLNVAAAELRRSASAIEAMRDAVFMFAPDTLQIYFVNRGAREQVGYTEAELLQMTPLNIKPALTEAQFREMVAPLLDGREQVLNFTTVHRHKDGADVPVEINLQLATEAGQRCFVALCRDVTERKRAEENLKHAHEDLRRANAELAQASRLKDEFLANMSHELRTPLNAILGLSEALLEQVSGTLTPRQIKNVTTISTSGQHLLALINDILDLSKIEAGKLELHAEPLNVQEFCESCLAFVRTQAMHKHITVEYEADPQLAHLTADPKRFKQVLVNLLTNAVKFTPEGGRIGLTVAVPEDGDAVRFTVWDSGIGIAAADQQKLFRAFTQIDSGLSRSQEGTGLGLALVAKLVELHGGSVTLESAPGQGSRFIVTLPRHVAPAKPAALTASPDRRSYRRAVIIEDEPTAGAMLVKYLAELGLQSVLHLSAEGALETVLRERPDVIVLDILLPGENGWVALARLKDHPGTRDIPVLVISVVDEPRKSLAYGAVAHFTKPVTRGQLAEFFQHPGRRLLPARDALRRALVIEDDPSAGEQLVRYLAELNLRSVLHTTGANAVTTALQERPDVILLDVQLPGESGWVVLAKLKEQPEIRDTPVVMVTVVDEPQKSLALGAAAHFTKPVTRAQLAGFFQRPVAPRVRSAPPLVPDSPARGPRILLAEDNEANIETIGGYLEDKGYAMQYASNGLVAVKLARDNPPALILMDIQMPVMDGLAAIRELRTDARFKATPIVALTALAMPGDRERCLAAGANDYMSKPVSLKALAALMERLVPAARGDGK